MLHPCHYYPAGHWSLWNVSDFSPRVVKTLKTWFHLHSESLPLFLFPLHSLPFPFNKITVKACSICLIAHLTFILFFLYARADNRGACDGQVWLSGLFSSCWWFPLCQSPKQGGNIQFNVTFLCSSSTARLTASTRAQVKFQIRKPFYPQWRNHSTYSPFPESNSYASKGCSIEYLWVTGLGNSV